MSSQKLSRREFLHLAGLTTAAGILAACAPVATQPAQPQAAQQEGASSDAPPAQVVTVSFMGWGGTEEDEGVRAAITKYEEENPNYKVTWLHTPDNYGEKFLANIAAGTPPDTAFIGSDVFRTYTRDGLLLDITDQLKSDPLLGAEDYFIQPQETDRCTYDGKWYGIGSCWVAPHIYYNADIFTEAGIEPPSNDPDLAWDWPQLLETARQLTVDANGNHPGDSGFDADNIKRWGIDWPTWRIPLHAAVLSNGGRWIDPDTQLIVLDQPEAIEGMQNIADLRLVHKVMPESSVFEQMGMSNTQMLESGQLAMAVDGSWALAWMHKIEATLGTAALPKMATPATDMQAHLHSALAATKEPEAAWGWVRFLSTPFYQTQFCKIGLWLPSQTALMSEEGLQSWITEGVHPEGFDMLLNKFVANHGHVLYMPPGTPKTDAIINPALDAIFVGDKTAEEALTQAVPEANAILQEEIS